MAYSPLQLANAFLQTGELADAKQVLTDYFAGNPNADDPDYEAIIRLWLDLLAHGDEPDQRLALSEYYRLPDFSPTDHIKHAMTHYRLGELANARAILQTAVSQYPNHDRLTESLLFIYKKQGDFKAGLALLNTLPPKWVWARWSGDFALIGRDYAVAIAQYSQAIHLLEAQYGLSDDAPAMILSSSTMTDAEGLTIMGVYAELFLARAEAYRQNNQPHDAKGDEARAKRLIPHDSTLT